MRRSKIVDLIKNITGNLIKVKGNDEKLIYHLEELFNGILYKYKEECINYSGKLENDDDYRINNIILTTDSNIDVLKQLVDNSIISFEDLFNKKDYTPEFNYNINRILKS